MEKTLSFIVAFIIMITLASCSNTNNSVPSENAVPTETQTLRPTQKPTEKQTERPTEAPTEPEPKIIASYDFEPIGLMAENRAWVKYDGDCYGVIDDSGKIIYSVRTSNDENIGVHDYWSDGYAYYSKGDRYIIIDSEGKECYTTPTNTEELQYSICGHGDNIFLLKKHVSSFSEDAYYISQIDPNGKEIKPFREIDSYLSTDFVYYGEGIFKSCVAWRNFAHADGGFYNASTTNSYIEGNSSKFISCFENGKALFCEYYSKGQPTLYVSADVFSSSDSYLQWRNSLTGADSIPEEAKPELNYPESVKIIGYGPISGDYYPLLLNGVDNNTYFTIVDSEGTEQYSPVKLSIYVPKSLAGEVDWSQINFSNGYLAFVDEGVIKVINPDGQADSYDSNKIINLDGVYLFTNNRIINLETKDVISQINKYDR